MAVGPVDQRTVLATIAPPPRSPELPAPATAGPKEIACWKCGRLIAKHAPVCWKCGAKPEDAPPPATLDDKACPFCRSMIPGDAQKCRSCGEWVAPDGAGAVCARVVGDASGVLAPQSEFAARVARRRARRERKTQNRAVADDAERTRTWLWAAGKYLDWLAWTDGQQPHPPKQAPPLPVLRLLLSVPQFPLAEPGSRRVRRP